MPTDPKSEAEAPTPESSLPAIRLVVGLGNPGAPYAGTRHNLGFQTLDRLAAAESLRWEKDRKHDCELAGWEIRPGHWVRLAKPLTFMNLSGRSVRSLAGFYKILPAEILAVCDDSNLPLGDLRVRLQGSSGGHNGLQSLADHLQTEQFPRLRLGIGPAPSGTALTDHVLKQFLPHEIEEIEHLTNRGVSAIKASLFFSVEKAMNQFNRRQSET